MILNFTQWVILLMLEVFHDLITVEYPQYLLPRVEVPSSNAGFSSRGDYGAYSETMLLQASIPPLPTNRSRVLHLKPKPLTPNPKP